METNSSLTVTGRIDAKTHDTERLREAADDYDSLSRAERLELAREVEPDDEQTVYNVTTDGLHEYFVDNLDGSNTSNEANLSAAWLALGTDGGSGTSSSDTDLNNRVYSEPVTSFADNGKELLTSTFLDSNEGNGQTFDELGLFTGDPANLGDVDIFMINHASFSSVTKDSSKTITFDVTLTFSDV